MNILLLSAHDDPKSYGSALFNTALGVFERGDNNVNVTELYAQGFNPVASKLDFQTASSTHANYMFEQQRTINTGTHFSPDIQVEMEKLKMSDLTIMHFPLWWGAPPAILKGWLDRILAMGFAWSGDARYQQGLMKGKEVLVVVTVGDPASYYSADGMHRASVVQHLYSLLHNTLAFCGFDVLKPYIIANTTAASSEELDAQLQEYQRFLQNITDYDEFIYRQS